MKKKLQLSVLKMRNLAMNAMADQELIAKKVRNARYITSLVMFAFCGFAMATNEDVGLKMYGLFGRLVQIIGVFLTGFSVVKLLMAMNNDNPDKQKEAAGSLVVGIVMLAMPTIMDNLGLKDKVATSNLGSSNNSSGSGGSPSPGN